MPDFKRLTSDFYVSVQLSEADVHAAKAAGFLTVINNRPDGEAPDQPPAAVIAAAARACGMEYVEIPIAGPPSDDAVADMAAALSSARRPILAYCRSGTRSTTLWAIATARAGALGADAILAAARDAGYDLAALAPRLAAENSR